MWQKVKAHMYLNVEAITKNPQEKLANLLLQV